MKIVIIGTNGFLSASIAKYAIERGWSLDMYGLDKPIHHTYTHYYPLDIMQGDIDVEELCKSEIIIYVVGAGIQSNLNESADLIYALNVNAPVRICNALKQADYKGVFVTFGSYFELGEANLHRPATEEDVITASAPAPTDYVVSKRMLTRFVMSYKHDYKHWHFVLPTIYGPGENPHRLIPYTINAIKNNEELHFTSGDQVRHYLYVGDVAEVLDTAYSKSLPSGIYNIAGHETMSVQEIVSTIHKSFKKPIAKGCFGEVQRSDTSMKYLVLDGKSMHDAIQWKSNTLLSDVIEKY